MEQVWGWMLLIGGAMGFLAVALSFLWHHIDKKMEALEPLPGETFDEADERWMRYSDWRHLIRQAGLVMLYGSLIIMCLGALGMGIDYVEQGIVDHGAQ